MNSLIAEIDSLYEVPSTSEVERVTENTLGVFKDYSFFSTGSMKFLSFIFKFSSEVFLRDQTGTVCSINRNFTELAFWNTSINNLSPHDNKNIYRQIPGSLKYLFKTLPEIFRKRNWLIIKTLIYVEKFKKTLGLPKEYLHLEMLLIPLENRGNHICSRLLNPVFEITDKKGVPVVLETNTVRNMEIYKHYGFEVSGETEYHGYPIWVMTRYPRE